MNKYFILLTVVLFCCFFAGFAIANDSIGSYGIGAAEENTNAELPPCRAIAVPINPVLMAEADRLATERIAVEGIEFDNDPTQIMWDMADPDDMLEGLYECTALQINPNDLPLN